MAVPFASRKHLNPRDLEAVARFYPAPAYIAEIGAIRSLLITVPKYMLLGYKVRLDSFGIFKLGVKNVATCKGHEKASKVSASNLCGFTECFLHFHLDEFSV